MEERLGRAEVDGLAERAMAARLGFDAMHRRVAKNAVAQYNTAQPGEFFYLAEVMQAGRQMAEAQRRVAALCSAAMQARAWAWEQGVARLFAADSSRAALRRNCRGLLPGELHQIKYSGSLGGAPAVSQARDQCVRLGVDDLIASRWDAVWSDPRGMGVDSSGGGRYRRGASACLCRAGALGVGITGGVACDAARAGPGFSLVVRRKI